MSSRARTSRHDKQGQKEDVGEPSISGSVGCAEVADGSIYEAGQVAE